MCYNVLAIRSLALELSRWDITLMRVNFVLSTIRVYSAVFRNLHRYVCTSGVRRVTTAESRSGRRGTRSRISRSGHAGDTFDKDTFRLLRANKGPRAAAGVHAPAR